jgi:hypothetical protein
MRMAVIALARWTPVVTVIERAVDRPGGRQTAAGEHPRIKTIFSSLAYQQLFFSCPTPLFYMGRNCALGNVTIRVLGYASGP